MENGMPLDNYDFTALAVDTNIFISNQFDFSGKKLGLLKRYRGSEVLVLIPRILYFEMLKHYEEKCQKERVKAQKGINSLSRFWGMIDNAEDLLARIENSGYADRKLMAFVNEIGADIISCDGIDVEKMIKLYNDAAPPFEDSKKKKEEFPDAIALLVLEQWAKNADSMVLFVSEDKKVQEFCENSNYVKATANLTDAYQYFLRDEDLLSRHLLENIRQFNLQEKISERLKGYVEDQMLEPEGESAFSFELSESYAEFSSFALEECDDCYKILDMDADDVVIEVYGTVKYIVHATFELYKYDSIDRDYVKMGTSSIKSPEGEEISVIITFSKGVFNLLQDLDIVDMEFPSVMDDLRYEDLEPDWMRGLDISDLDYEDEEEYAPLLVL